MARAIWSGSISFGLVNVPVKLYSAVHQQDIHFSQFDKNGNHIRYKRVSEKSGKEVDYGDIVKGYEVKKGQWVMVDPDELAEYRPEATKTIDISDFVALDEIDPIYYESTYYLAPDGKSAGKPYNLLLEAMEKQQKVAIGKVVLRTKQYLAAIRPLEGVLALSTMLFADEVVPASEVTNGSSSSKDASVSKREVDMASQIIDSLTAEWDPSRYHDSYREQVLELLKKKAKGEEVVIEQPQEEGGQVLDLMAALEASLAEAKKGGKKPAAKKSSRTRKATKKKASSSRSRSRAKKSA